MIRFGDSFLLAKTKLNSRKVRLVITVVVAGLLFVGLFVVSLIFNGVMKSVEQFSEDGFGKRYITKIEKSPMGDDFALLTDPQLIASSKQADKALVAAKTAEAKRLGIDYDPKMEVLSTNEQMTGPNGQPMLIETPQSSPLIRSKRTEASKEFFASVKDAEANYRISHSYWLISLANQSFGPPGQGLDSTSLSVIKDGKEPALNQSQNNSGYAPPSGFASLPNGLSAADSGLLNVFLLPGQSLESKAGEPIGLIAPFTAAEEALGLPKLPQSASSNERLERLKVVRSKAAGLTFQVCLRNTTSISRLSEAESTTDAIEKNKNNKDFVKPDLIYSKSNQPCQDVAVSRDVRTAEQKVLDQKRADFDAKFGKIVAKQRIVTFRIAGVAPDPPSYTGAFSFNSIVSSMLVSNLGTGWFMPLEARDQLPEYSDAFAQIGVVDQYNISRLLEFESADEARRFNKEKSCDIGGAFMNPTDVVKDCKARNTPFFLSGFGSNSVALESAKKSFSTGFYRIALVVATISVIITMGTIGKVVADSRRETAVFRAIGAKRIDIAQIYLLYATMLGVVVIVFASCLAVLLATIAQSRYSSGLTIDALTAFNSTNLERKFNLVAVDYRQLAILSALIISGALFSSLVPLLSNLKRNPIKDMRDER